MQLVAIELPTDRMINVKRTRAEVEVAIEMRLGALFDSS
jgi:hypothetical protein